MMMLHNIPFAMTIGWCVGIVMGLLMSIWISMRKFYETVYVDIEGGEEIIDPVLAAFKFDKSVWIRIWPDPVFRKEHPDIKSIIRISKPILLPWFSGEDRTLETTTYLKQVLKKSGLKIIDQGAY